MRVFPAIVCIGLAIGGAAASGAGPDGKPAATPAALSARIDAYFERYWAENGLRPAPLADDAAFLRRTTLDLTGIIPEVGEVRAFLADDDPARRTRLVSDLLGRPRHAAHLANVWQEVLLPRTVPDSTAAAFENWLQTRFAANVPYDALVREILLARGTLTQSPPVLYYAALDTKPSELAASSTRAFLGMQIRCAECHDHPFTEWRQQDFWAQAAFFARVSGPSQQGGPAVLADISTGEVQHPTTKKTVAPAFLDGTPVNTTTAEPRRAQFAAWVTSRENPYFARAAVNRAWSVLFGRGLVEPVDDLGDHNPAVHPEVLELLARDFIASGYDLRRTFEVVAGTKIYQRSATTAGGGQSDAEWLTTYTAMPVRSLSAEQMHDGLVRAAGRRDPLDPQDPRLAAQRAEFLAALDAPTRQATEFQGGIPQTLMMLNGPLVAELTDPLTGDLVAALADSPFLTDRQRIETLFLATVSRPPNEQELRQATDLFRGDGDHRDTARALGDVLWALLNSSEFLLNH